MSARATTRTRPAATPRRVGTDRSRRRRTSAGAPRTRSTARSTRERRLGRRGRIALVVGLVASVAFALVSWFGPVWAVRDIEVTGNFAVSEEEILATLAVPEGLPLPRVDTDAAATAVAAIPEVASARVQRMYPSTVRVTVAERIPVVFFDAADGTHLMDASAVDFAAAAPPPGVVRLVVASPSFGNLETRAALAVLTALPPQLRSQVSEIAAPTISAVSLTLFDGRTVVWGSSERSDYKAAVALPLLTQPGATYDVSSPDLPTIR